MLSRRDPLGFGCVWVRPMDHLDLDDDPVVAGVVDGADAVLDEVVVGGGGGGRPDMAQAGGKQPENLPKLIAQAPAVVAALLG